MIRGLVSNPPLNALASGRVPLTAILRAYDPLLRRTAVDAPAGWGFESARHTTFDSECESPARRRDAKGPAVVRVGVRVVGVRGNIGSHRARRGAASQGAAQLQRRLECFLGRRRLARQIAVRSRERSHLKQLPAGFLPYRRLGGTLARRQRHRRPPHRAREPYRGDGLRSSLAARRGCRPQGVTRWSAILSRRFHLDSETTTSR